MRIKLQHSAFAELRAGHVCMASCTPQLFLFSLGLRVNQNGAVVGLGVMLIPGVMGWCKQAKADFS